MLDKPSCMGGLLDSSWCGWHAQVILKGDDLTRAKENIVSANTYLNTAALASPPCQHKTGNLQMSSNTENIPNTFQNFTFRVVAYRLVILVWDGKRFNKSNTMYEEVDLSCNYLASNWPREQNSPRFDPIRQYLETLVFKYSRSLRDRFKRL